MSAEYKDLIGKSIAEVASLLPVLPWYVQCHDPFVEFRRLRIAGLALVAYETKELRVPKKQDDIYEEMPVVPEIDINMAEFRKRLSEFGSNRTVGILSRVRLDCPYPGFGQYLHLPFLDFDTQQIELPLEAKLEKIKNEIQDKIGMVERGLILNSGGRDESFRFIGLERLLTEKQLVTFLGRSLRMAHYGMPLADQYWVGNSLDPSASAPANSSFVAHMIEGMRFATLRLTANELKPEVPKVIDVME